jgi:hypothetical protein
MANTDDKSSDSLSSDLRRLQEQIRLWMHDTEADNSRLQQQVRQLQHQLERAEAERLTVLIAGEEERERWERERDGLVLDLLQRMGKGRPFILDMLETLEEPDSTLASRDVLAEFKRWIRDVSGQRMSRFPTEAEAPGGYITLTPDELTDLYRGFDVGNERPFAGEQELVTFRVVRKGWRLGTQILHPARLSAFGVEERPTGDAEREDL